MLPKIPKDWDVPAFYGRWVLSPPGTSRGFYCSVAQLSLGMGGNFRSFMALGKDFGLCSKKKYLRLCPGCYGHRFSCICGKPLWPADNSSWCLRTLITHLGELKALTSCSGRSAPVGSCPHSQWWSGAGPCWPCTWKILGAGFLHSSFRCWPSGSRYAALRSTQCLVGRRGVGRKQGDRNEDGIIRCKYGKQSIFYLNRFLLFFCSHQISLQLESMSGNLKTFNRRDSLYWNFHYHYYRQHSQVANF